MFIVLKLLLYLAGARALPYEKRSSSGPVISSNFQDPCVLQVGDTWFAYSGPNGNPGVNVQIATSTDFTNWQVVPNYEVLPTHGPWAALAPHVWAPHVIQLSNGQFVLYYAAATASNPGKHCVGAATASQPQGPFQPLDSPLFCDLSAGGAIDPNGVVDPKTGNQYIVYKVDGNSIGNGGACSNSVAPKAPTPIVLQQVSSIDGTTIVGNPVEIMTKVDSDGAMIEAPALTYDSSSQTYILFFNSGCFTDTSYQIQYATSKSITGPYKRQGTFMTTGSTAGNVHIPGGIDVVRDGSRAVFHGDTNMGWFQGDGTKRVRAMYAIDLSINGQRVSAGQLL